MTPETYEQVAEHEFFPAFAKGMKDRMVVSFHKYGPVKLAAEKGVDFIASLEKRLAKYKETGNTEWLMDVGNFAMIEWAFPQHPQAHFRGTDSHESPGRVHEGVETSEKNRELGGNQFDQAAYDAFMKQVTE